MTITVNTKKKIIEHLKEVLKEKMKKYEPETTYSPFMNSIVRERKLVYSYSFIHSLYTSMGMSAYEPVSKIIAESKKHTCVTQWKSAPKVAKKRLEKIEEIIIDVGNGTRISNRKSEQKEILAISKTNLIQKKDGQIVDVYINTGKKECYFDIKTVKPNKSGFLDHKRRALTWIARADKPIISAIAFPYNPYHPEPYIRNGFDKLSEEDVYIGKNYWDFIGGNGCYEQVLDAFEIAGKTSWLALKKKFGSLSYIKKTKTKKK